jgi:hypothetical protein
MQFMASFVMVIIIYNYIYIYKTIKIFNALPTTTTTKDTFGNPKKFKVALKHYLLTHSFHNVDFQWTEYLTHVMLETTLLYKF